MKYLFLLGLFTFVAVLIYWRLRPYIQVARRIFGAVRDVRRMSVPQQQPADLRRSATGGRQQQQQQRGAATTSGERLVRCATCETWLPASRALSLRSSQSSFYCSHACLEQAADAHGPTRKSAS